MEPALYPIFSGYIFPVVIPLSNTKKTTQMQDTSWRESQSYSPSKFPYYTPHVCPVCTKRQTDSAKGQGYRSLWWPCIPVIPKRTGSQLRALLETYSWMHYSYEAAWHGFLSFTILSHTTAHNSLGIHMKEMSSDCHQQLFCFCAISVFLSHLALWPRMNAYGLILHWL